LSEVLHTVNLFVREVMPALDVAALAREERRNREPGASIPPQ
jgi:hypothetical protein